MEEGGTSDFLSFAVPEAVVVVCSRCAPIHDGEHTRGNFGRRFQGAFLLVEVEKAVGVGDDGEVKGREMVWLLLACV